MRAQEVERVGGSGAQDRDALIAAAFDTIGAGVLVLDRTLSVVVATRTAERILGLPVPTGSRAIPILHGYADGALAEALTDARPTVATVTSARSGESIHVRAIPLRSKGLLTGWVLRLSTEAATDGTVERLDDMITRDATVKSAFRIATKLAPLDSHVLIAGEPGVGKRSMAQAIHRRSARHDLAFRVVTCARLTPESLEQQLLGNATGTVFLDDVAALPRVTQAELLRILESGTVTPRDGRATQRLEARVIVGASSPLARDVERRGFRADLFVCLGSVAIELPPLRARRHDIALLADEIVRELNAKGGPRVDTISPEAMMRLTHYDWPGNVRELRATLEHGFIAAQTGTLTASDLPATVGEPLLSTKAASGGAPLAREGTDERTRISRALERAAGDRDRAAHILGISRTTLWRRIKALGIKDPRHAG